MIKLPAVKKPSNSKKKELNKTDWEKIGIGAAIAVLGALSTYVADVVPNLDLNGYEPMAAAFAAVVLNILRKYFTDYSDDIEDEEKENEAPKNQGMFPTSLMFLFILIFWIGSSTETSMQLQAQSKPAVESVVHTSQSVTKPNPIIKGPTKAVTGSLIVLTAEVDADFYDWKIDTSDVIIPSNASQSTLSSAVELLESAGYTIERSEDADSEYFLMLNDGQSVVLASYPGTWRTNLAVSNSAGVAQKSHIVVVSGPDGYVPDKPEPPKDDDDDGGNDDDKPEPPKHDDDDGGNDDDKPEPPKHDFQLASEIKKLLQNVPQATKDREASAVRNALANAADAAFRGDYKTIAEADAAVAKSFTELHNKGWLTVRDWAEFGGGLNMLFSALVASGEVDSVHTWGLALREVVGAM